MRSFSVLQHFRWLSSSEYMHSIYPNLDVELYNGFWDEVCVLDRNIYLCTDFP